MSQTIRQESNESEYSFEAIVAVNVLEEFLDRISAIFGEGGECKIHLGDDGIWTRAVDPANVAMVDLSLAARRFESYEGADGGVLGVNIGRLQEMLSVADGGDLVHLGLNQETRKLDLSVPNVGTEFELALIDPSVIRQEPDIPELEPPVEVVFEAAWLQRAMTVADMVSDHVTIASDGGADPNLVFSADGDTDSGTTRLGPEDIIDGTASSDAESIFSLDYLQPTSKVFDGDDELTMALGEEFPTKIHFEFADGDGEGTYMIAPRIQDR